MFWSLGFNRTPSCTHAYTGDYNCTQFRTAQNSTCAGPSETHLLRSVITNPQLSGTHIGNATNILRFSWFSSVPSGNMMNTHAFITQRQNSSKLSLTQIQTRCLACCHATSLQWNIAERDFRLPPRCSWALRSSGLLRSVGSLPTFRYIVSVSYTRILTLQDRADMLSRNVCYKPMYTAQQRGSAKILALFNVTIQQKCVPNRTSSSVLQMSLSRHNKRRSLTLRRLMSYIYGAPILDVSRSHTTTQYSR